MRPQVDGEMMAEQSGVAYQKDPQLSEACGRTRPAGHGRMERITTDGNVFNPTHNSNSVL